VKKSVSFAMSVALFAGLNTSVALADTLHYRVESGNSLYQIAEEYHTSVVNLKTWNHLDSNLIHVGQELLVHADTRTQSSQGSTVTVEPGDSIWSISQAHGVTMAELERWNGLNNDSILHTGQTLRLYGTSGSMVLSARSDSPASAQLTNAVLGERIAEFSKQFDGYPYVWAGTSPSGFDCSGLVYFVYLHFGMNLGESSYTQFDEGTHVAESDLQPGDLVFFDTDGGGASHVGIYLGNGNFISAQTPQSGVQIASLYNSYWSNHYVGASRIV
jgi:peptidoglycan endopeptidase LytE